MRSQRIVFCPVGDAQHRAALREAVAFARSSEMGCVIDLLAVIPEASAWDRLAHSEHVNTIIADQTAAWTATLERWTKEFDCVDNFEVRIGHTADAITQHALDEAADLVILSAGTEQNDQAIVRRVLRSSESPVWVLRPTRAKKRRILAAVNPEPAELELNLAIIDEASSLAKRFDGELSVVATWELYGEQTMRRSAFIRTPIEHYHDLFNLREELTTRGLAELALAAELPERTELIVENGVPAPTILDTIHRKRINMLVVGTVGRAGLTGMLLGNTAEHLADSASCSVYAVKPPGFRSPLR